MRDCIPVRWSIGLEWRDICCSGPCMSPAQTLRLHNVSAIHHWFEPVQTLN